MALEARPITCHTAAWEGSFSDSLDESNNIPGFCGRGRHSCVYATHFLPEASVGGPFIREFAEWRASGEERHRRRLRHLLPALTAATSGGGEDVQEAERSRNKGKYIISDGLDVYVGKSALVAHALGAGLLDHTCMHPFLSPQLSAPAMGSELLLYHSSRR
jgi:hypothetical protein